MGDAVARRAGHARLRLLVLQGLALRRRHGVSNGVSYHGDV